MSYHPSKPSRPKSSHYPSPRTRPPPTRDLTNVPKSTGPKSETLSSLISRFETLDAIGKPPVFKLPPRRSRPVQAPPSAVRALKPVLESRLNVPLTERGESGAAAAKSQSQTVEEPGLIIPSSTQPRQLSTIFSPRPASQGWYENVFVGDESPIVKDDVFTCPPYHSVGAAELGSLNASPSVLRVEPLELRVKERRDSVVDTDPIVFEHDSLPNTKQRYSAAAANETPVLKGRRDSIVDSASVPKVATTPKTNLIRQNSTHKTALPRPVETSPAYQHHSLAAKKEQTIKDRIRFYDGGISPSVSSSLSQPFPSLTLRSQMHSNNTTTPRREARYFLPRLSGKSNIHALKMAQETTILCLNA